MFLSHIKEDQVWVIKFSYADSWIIRISAPIFLGVWFPFLKLFHGFGWLPGYQPSWQHSKPTVERRIKWHMPPPF